MTLAPLLPRLSSATRYATHAMLEIAEANGQVVRAATIAEHQQLPGHFLDQLLAKLRRAGLLTACVGHEVAISWLARPLLSASPTSWARSRAPRALPCSADLTIFSGHQLVTAATR